MSGTPCQGRSASVLVYREWILPDCLAHMGQRAVRAEVFAERVIAFASARTLMRFSSLGAGRIVRESDMGNLDHPRIFSAAACRTFSSKARKNRLTGGIP